MAPNCFLGFDVLLISFSYRSIFEEACGAKAVGGADGIQEACGAKSSMFGWMGFRKPAAQKQYGWMGQCMWSGVGCIERAADRSTPCPLPPHKSERLSSNCTLPLGKNSGERMFPALTPIILRLSVCPSVRPSGNSNCEVITAKERSPALAPGP